MFNIIDGYLIFFFRLTSEPILGYLIGIAVLALLCAGIGSLTVLAATLANSRHLIHQNREMVQMQNLSVKALVAKDKSAYKLLNREANDAFGKYFFAQVAMSVSYLWPAPFALAWLQERFADVDFFLPVNVPGVGSSVGYTFSFIPMYILVSILFSKVKRRLPLFDVMNSHLDTIRKDADAMVTIADYLPPATAPAPHSPKGS